ncbi:ArsR/SmtB family transcription factor [Undibacterium sp. Dicai25W]|uniref:ArsR/SmtB family transcription factor n=1 Tax=Undibacterium sp. Dicai25W TaxID=3413034 RepID=UPI003BF33984
MDADFADTRLARLAAAIAEPARARMLCSLMDGHARTGTELAAIAEIGTSTASVHLAKLKEQQLVQVIAQGKHRYYQLGSSEVAAALESLLAIAGAPQPRFKPSTPPRLRHARTCYDHMAGELAVKLHDSCVQQIWLVGDQQDNSVYELSQAGEQALTNLGIDVDLTRQSRRRFACTCLDWSERRPHLGGALGAALLALSLKHKWLERDLDSRALSLTREGKKQFQRHFAIVI